MPGRVCETCGTANEADARYCEGCGGAMARRCHACGTPANPTARFCRSCGTALGLPEQPPVSPTRKTVTVLFADLAGSTAFEEQVDAETAREVIGGYHELLRSTAEQNHAGVVKYIGDGFMAVWGVPNIGPEDADHAVAAAVDLQERFVDLANRVGSTHRVELALRVAVNTGEVVVGAGDADLVGDAVNVAARLESECPHGQVVVGEETWRATRGHHRYEQLGRVQVKGRAAAVPVYQWTARRSEPAESITFVGRGEEFRRLQTVLDDAVAHRAARLVTVIGDPGVGKTRLAAEFAAHSRVAVIAVRCATEGSVALAPLVDMIRIRDPEGDVPGEVGERDRILRGLADLDTGAATSVEETFWALRRYIEVLAAGQPLIVVVDDIQWADSLLLEFLDHLTQWVRDAPVLVLALTRPEIRDSRADLVSVGGGVADAIRLGGLDACGTAELAGHVLGGDRLPPTLLERLPSSTGGNPLFVRELVGMLVHDGVLVSHPDGWRLTIDADAITVPPTIQALLASRLERMNSGDRRILEVASVIGTDFFPGALGILAGLDTAAVRSALDRLRRHELAQPSGAYLGDEPIWRFHHVLIRDVGYRRLLKSDRADLHERFADWVQAGGPTGAVDPEQLAARHLEAAHGYRRDLDLHDEHTAALAERSARGYLAAARRALDRDAVVSAGTQAARGAALADADPGLRAELLQVACEAFLADGDVTAAAPLVDELEAVAGEALARAADCFRCQFLVYTDPSRLREVDHRLDGVIEEFVRRGDAAGLAKAYRVRAAARARLGRIGDAELDLFEALIAARRGGDHRQITAVLGYAPNAALWGPSAVPKAGGRCLDVVRMQRMTTGAPSLEATSLRCLAVLEVLRGRPDKARTMLADARAILGDLGLRHGLMETELHAGIVELMVGDPVAAEPHFRTALEGLGVLGVGADAGQAAALLARSVLAQGRLEEADRFATQSEQIAGHNLKSAIAWRAVRAEILSAQGRHAEATAMATEAVAVAAGTDLVLDHAEACLALSRVLAAAGDSRGATIAHAQAESLYAAKEAVFGATRAPLTETPAAEPAGRLALANCASAVVDAVGQALLAGDSAPLFGIEEDTFVYEDRRSVPGNPIIGSEEFLQAASRKYQQYSHLENRTLAVRGDTVALVSLRWWDDAGNETAALDLIEVSADGARMLYHGRFDTDDFAAAYAEMEKRYYAGEGREYAVNGLAATRWVQAMSDRDIDAAREVSMPDFRWLAPESALKPTQRSVPEFFGWLAERHRQVTAVTIWLPTMRWHSPTCVVARGEINGTGPDGEDYRWNAIHVAEYRDGKALSNREFEADQEDEAFAYAESLAGGPADRLTLSNSATAAKGRIIAALRAGDVEAFADCYAEDVVQHDRRRISGVPIIGRDQMRAGVRRIFAQYSRFDTDVLAVRGDRLMLARSCWVDEAGNRTEQLHLAEVDGDDRFFYDGRFDADDFTLAYAELGRRYRAGEGAEFAVNAAVIDGFMRAMDSLDLVAARRLCVPGFTWESTPSTLAAERRSLEEFFGWVAERARQASTVCNFGSVLQWVSPDCLVAMGDVLATGADGERFGWSRPYVAEFRDGLLASMRQLEDVAAAFAYAESLHCGPSRLSVENRCSQVSRLMVEFVRRSDFDAVASCYAEAITYVDRRGLNGSGLIDRGAMVAALRRLREHYTHFDGEVLAVRGEGLAFGRYICSDDNGNESTGLIVREVDADDCIVYEARYDESAFGEAYRDLHRRYYAGEGAEFAAHGLVSAAVSEALNRNDIDTVRRLTTPYFRWHAPDSALKSTQRTIDDMLAWAGERGRQVASQRSWLPVTQWLSPRCAIALVQVSARGHDGENFSWAIPFVSEFRDGLLASCREFSDEIDAFHYADAVLATQETAPELRNTATAASAGSFAAALAGDLDAVQSHYATGVVSEDRRRLGGDGFIGRDQIRDAMVALLSQFTIARMRTVAVRGDRLQLMWIVFSDDSGNQSSQNHVVEVDGDGLIAYAAFFDGDDFDSAYRELEARYYAGEGRLFADNGMVAVAWVAAIQHLDLEAARALCQPDFSWTCPPTALSAETRCVDEFFEWQTQRAGQAASVRSFCSEIRWPAVNCMVATTRVVAVNPDDDPYTWDRFYTCEFRDNLVAAVREFDDHAAALAYAAGRVRSFEDRLPVRNLVSATSQSFTRAMQEGDLDAAVAHFADGWVMDDHRRLAGDPIRGQQEVRSALPRILAQYNHFESHPLAVRGDRLELARSRWRDDDGNVSDTLHVNEVDANGRLASDSRFDADDFAGAYTELERRYCAGEGAAFAEHQHLVTEYVLALNRGDWQTIFEELTSPDLHVQNHCRSGFPDRSATDLRASLTELRNMLSSVRWWYSAVHWLSPTLNVSRMERQGWGHDGAHYSWTRLLVSRVRDGRVDAIWEFDPDDQAAAFACAEQQIAAAQN